MTELLPNFAAGDSLATPQVSNRVRTNAVTATVVDYAGRRWRFIMSPRCETCCHPQVHEINELAVLDSPAKRIIRVLDLDLSVGQINRHLREHLPGVRSAVVGIAAVLRAAGSVLDTIEALTPEMVAQTVMERGMGALMRGELEIKAGDVLNAAKLTAELDKAGAGTLSVDLYAEAIKILCETVQGHMNDQDFARFMWQVRSHPRMRAIIAASDGQDVIEATALDRPMIELSEALVASL